MIQEPTIEFLRVTENAALVAGTLQGRTDPFTIVNNARNTMVKKLSTINIKISLKNDRFLNHEKITALPKILNENEKVACDIITASIEGHKACANGKDNVSSFLVATTENGFIQLPNLYMYKIIVGQGMHDLVDITKTPTINIKRVARALGKHIENTTVCILDRERHRNLIKEVALCGARIKLIPDGDISASLAVIQGQGIDMSIGYGGVLEGQITAAAIRCMGGFMQGIIHYYSNEQRHMAQECGITDFQKIFYAEDLVSSSDVTFTATGITNGLVMKGVAYEKDGAFTHSFISRSKTHTVRDIKTRHYFDYKHIFDY